MSSTTEKAFANLANITGQPDAEKARIAEVQRQIDFTMAQTIRESGYNPNQLNPNLAVTPAGAGKVHVPGEWEPPQGTPGWSEPQPLVTPEARATDQAIERLADHFQPHGVASPLRKTGGIPLIPGGTGGPKE
jgi:hypothetical protein